MIKIEVMGKAAYGKTIEEVKAKLFDYLINPEIVLVYVDEYTVQPDDTLYSIAKKLYGDSISWQEIAKINRDVVPNARYIYPGTVLRLPKPYIK